MDYWKALIIVAQFVIGTYSQDFQIVTYWGQNSAYGADRRNEKPLAELCRRDSPFDIINIGFVQKFFDELNSDRSPGLNLDGHCTIPIDSNHRSLFTCPLIEQGIRTCQQNGKKVLIAIGGPRSTSSFDGEANAEKFAENIWDLFLGGDEKPDLRPFASATCDGVNLLIAGGSSTGYPAFIRHLFFLAKRDHTRKYIITASPSCHFPDTVLGPEPNKALETVAKYVNHLYVRFYGASCGVAGNSLFEESLNSWLGFAKRTLQRDGAAPVIFIGVPAMERATPVPGCYQSTRDLREVYKRYRENKFFGGFMIWDASWDYTNFQYGKTFTERLYMSMQNVEQQEAENFDEDEEEEQPIEPHHHPTMPITLPTTMPTVQPIANTGPYHLPHAPYPQQQAPYPQQQTPYPQPPATDPPPPIPPATEAPIQPEDIPEEDPNEDDDEMKDGDQEPEQTPEELPEQTPEEPPEEIPEQTPEEPQEETPEQAPEEPQEETLEQTPEQPQEETPEQPQEETPEQTPEQPQEETPEQTPEQEAAIDVDPEQQLQEENQPEEQEQEDPVQPALPDMENRFPEDEPTDEEKTYQEEKIPSSKTEKILAAAKEIKRKQWLKRKQKQHMSKVISSQESGPFAVSITPNLNENIQPNSPPHRNYPSLRQAARYPVMPFGYFTKHTKNKHRPRHSKVHSNRQLVSVSGDGETSFSGSGALSFGVSGSGSGISSISGFGSGLSSDYEQPSRQKSLPVSLTGKTPSHPSGSKAGIKTINRSETGLLESPKHSEGQQNLPLSLSVKQLSYPSGSKAEIKIVYGSETGLFASSKQSKGQQNRPLSLSVEQLNYPSVSKAGIETLHGSDNGNFEGPKQSKGQQNLPLSLAVEQLSYPSGSKAGIKTVHGSETGLLASSTESKGQQNLPLSFKQLSYPSVSKAGIETVHGSETGRLASQKQSKGQQNLPLSFKQLSYPSVSKAGIETISGSDLESESLPYYMVNE